MSLSRYWMLVDEMARMSLKAEAARLYFGYVWWVLEPLLYVGIFYLVFDVILDSGRADFLVFLMCGKLMFVWFSKSVTLASTSIISSRGLISKIDIPKSLFPVSRIQEGLYKQIWVLLLLVVFLWFNGYGINPAYVWLPVVLLVNYLMILVAGMLAAYLVCLVYDFGVLVSLSMTFLLFVSGVFWDPRALGSVEATQWLFRLNPMAFILDAYRQILMEGLTPNTTHLFSLGVACVLIAGLLVLLMRRHSQFLALRAITH